MVRNGLAFVQVGITSRAPILLGLGFTSISLSFWERTGPAYVRLRSAERLMRPSSTNAGAIRTQLSQLRVMPLLLNRLYGAFWVGHAAEACSEPVMNSAISREELHTSQKLNQAFENTSQAVRPWVSK